MCVVLVTEVPVAPADGIYLLEEKKGESGTSADCKWAAGEQKIREGDNVLKVLTTVGQGGVTEKTSKVANWNSRALHSFPLKSGSSQGTESVGYTQGRLNG